jgi:uroporphyrinogen III methyltransferase/synthase
MPSGPATGTATTPSPGGGRVLFPRATEARAVLAPGLRAKGWHVDEVEAYRTVTAGPADGATAEVLESAASADVITFSSPSTIAAYLALSAGRVPPFVACIGPVTAAAAREAGLSVDAVAGVPTATGLVDAVAAEAESVRSGRARR